MNLLPASEYRRIIAEKIPKGTVVPMHDEFGHRYRHVPTGMTTRSVTTKAGILEAPHLKKWSVSLGIELIDKNWDAIVKASPEDRDKWFKQAIMVHDDVFRDAGNIGTMGHGGIERYLNAWMATGVRPADIKEFVPDPTKPGLSVDGRLYAIARSAELFMRDFDVEPVASELLVASVKHKLAGTLDGMAIVSKVLKKGADVTNLFGECGCPHQTWWSLSTRNNQLVECRDCGKRVKRVLALLDWKTSNSIDKAEYAMQVSAYWYAFAEMTGIKPEEILVVRLDKERAKYEVRRITDKVKAFRAYKNTAAVYDWLTDGKEKLVDVNSKERVTLDNIQFQTV